MEKTSALSRSARRSLSSATLLFVALGASATIGSCGNSQPNGSIANNALPAVSTAAPTTPAPVIAPPTAAVPTGATPTVVNPVTPTPPVTPTDTPPVPVTPDTDSTIDMSTSGPVEAPCEDVEPPPDPEWPDATCATWASETEECSADWFKDYCNVSCGRCVPASVTLPPAPEPPPCEDIEPPPDPEWPDATCTNWATETEECSADWFKGYCDISCGRCVPAGGTPEPEPVPEPEKCEDVEPPPDPEWPGATCAEWASETEECSADWFQDYCDVSCGRCVPEGGTPDTPSGAVDCSGEGLPNVSGGDGFATRYWDCCQPHCAQFDGHKCSQDGTSRTGDSNSSCNGGGSFACYDEAPHAVSDCLAYGYIAKANPNCGGCYRIQFTGEGYHNASDPGSQLIKGKQMIVKVSNTGGDVAANQFDLMIPGGGVGQFNACSRQWGTNDLGAQYGGFLTNCTGSHEAKKECVRTNCQKIPAGSARDGCLWFVDWMQVADNPKFTSQQTDCPF